MKLTFRYKGGAGSGFHGHQGRPGKQGGSVPEGSPDMSNMTDYDKYQQGEGKRRRAIEQADIARLDAEEASRKLAANIMVDNKGVFHSVPKGWDIDNGNRSMSRKANTPDGEVKFTINTKQDSMGNVGGFQLWVEGVGDSYDKFYNSRAHKNGLWLSSDPAKGLEIADFIIDGGVKAWRGAVREYVNQA